MIPSWAISDAILLHAARQEDAPWRIMKHNTKPAENGVEHARRTLHMPSGLSLRDGKNDAT
jgi:hypothetical protein